MRLKRWIAITGLFAVVAGIGISAACSTWMKPRDPQIDLRNGVHCDVYEAGKNIGSGDVAGDAWVVRRLGKLLRDGSGKWKTSWVTYAPGIAFKREKFSIAVQQSRFIVNYEDENRRWSQVITDIAPDVLAEMRDNLMKSQGMSRGGSDTSRAPVRSR